MCPKINAFPSD